MIKLTKPMFHDWTDEDDNHDITIDDELMIEHDPKVSSKSIADHILKCQKLMELVEERNEAYNGSNPNPYQLLLDEAMK